MPATTCSAAATNGHCLTPDRKLKKDDKEFEIDNLRIEKFQALIYPQLLLEEIPINSVSKKTVVSSRREIARIVRGETDRLIVVVGPCSIHDPKAAMEYARRLAVEAEKHQEHLKVVMRVYFEKPRTTVGWKGLVNDPDLDGSFQVNKGLRIGRRLLGDITSLGLPVGCEYLDTLIPQYTADLVSWGAIGARTTECQLHRELASGLSMPVGFKNGTTGDIQIAVDACVSARHPHSFLGITSQGLPAICHSIGNPDAHIILRGSTGGPNFESSVVESTAEELGKKGCPRAVVVDFSHGNSQKDHKKQKVVCDDICRQLEAGSSSIVGVMIESHLNEGSQSLPVASQVKCEQDPRSKPFSMAQDPSILSKLRYGVSVTDKCVSWDETVVMLSDLAEAVQKRRKVL